MYLIYFLRLYKLKNLPKIFFRPISNLKLYKELRNYILNKSLEMIELDVYNNNQVWKSCKSAPSNLKSAQALYKNLLRVPKYM